MLNNLVRWAVVLTVVGAVASAGYLAYATVSLVPPAEAVARAFLARLSAGDVGAAYELVDPRVQTSLSRDAFMADVGRRAMYYSGVKGVALAGQEIDGVSHITMRGPVTYGAGLTGDLTISLARGEHGWRVLSHELACPDLMASLREQALAAGREYMESRRGDSHHNIDDFRFMEARTQVEFPRYTLHGTLHTSDGLPHQVELQLTWKREGFTVTGYRLDADSSWLAEQKHVAKQVATNFVLALKSGSAPEMMATCHPKLVQAVGRPRFEEMAAEFPRKLADISFDDARSTAQHPIYEIVGVQRTIAGATLPASIRVQYVDGSYVITALSFE